MWYPSSDICRRLVGGDKTKVHENFENNTHMMSHAPQDLFFSKAERSDGGGGTRQHGFSDEGWVEDIVCDSGLIEADLILYDMDSEMRGGWKAVAEL